MRNKHISLRRLWEVFPPYKKARLIVLNNFLDEQFEEVQLTGEFPVAWRKYADCRVLFIDYYGSAYFYIVATTDRVEE